MAEFGYPPIQVSDSSLDDWLDVATAALPFLRGYIERHERIAQLSRLTRHSTLQITSASEVIDPHIAQPTIPSDYEGALDTHAVP